MANNSRRKFIKNSVKAGLVIAFINPFKLILAGSNVNTVYPLWKDLIEYARWCPTVHNLQAHRVKIISESEAELYYDPSNLLPVGDPDSIFGTVAIGVFIEHLAIVAGAHGTKISIEKLYDSITTKANGLTLFAKLKLSPSFQKEELDKELIKKRKTSRLHYDGIPLRETTLIKINREATKFGHDFFCSSEKEFSEFVVQLNQTTLFEDLESQAQRDELHRLFRYSKKDAEEKKDGLWSKCMGFSGPLMKSVFTHHEKWEKGMRKKVLSNYYENSFKGTSTICWYSGKFDTTQDWLNAGRMLARNWLNITEDDGFLHPFGSLVTNEGAYAKINEKFKNTNPDNKIWMIFRAGYSKEPVRSYRLSTEEILIQ